MTPIMSVVIPAHDEVAIIERTLLPMLEGDDELEIIVVANACNDHTAAVVTNLSSRIRVVEIDEASKIAALNAGDAVATVLPRAYVDADVRVSLDALRALAVSLADPCDARVAAPSLRVSTSNASWAVRRYYQAWALSTYRRDGHVGSGIYAVSAAGRSRWATFPDVIADDRFVQLQFSAQERTTLADHYFEVPAPRTLGAVIRRGARIKAGNVELHSLQVPGAASRPGVRAMLTIGVRQPRLWAALGVYCVAYAAIVVRAGWIVRRPAPIAWNRDDSSRESTTP